MVVGWWKERESWELCVKGWSFEEDKRGEREEKKSLKVEKVEEEKGGKERRVLMDERSGVVYWAGLGR